MKILVTGGAGYIGTHACIELLNEGHDVIVIDNLINSNYEGIKRVEGITHKTIDFFDIDLSDYKKVKSVFNDFNIDAVMHFAGLKSVGESVNDPLKYYSNNLNSTFNLCRVMSEYQVRKMIFSSSSTVYGIPKSVPVNEKSTLSAYNPYGHTKLIIEQFLKDLCQTNNQWQIFLLRYFNPIGAHASGMIGEDPRGVPNNLLPYISQVAIKKLDMLPVYGNKYPTPDGTCIRDYIHVVDLVKGHIAALNYIDNNEKEMANRAIPVNLGTGRGYSVLEILEAFENACGYKLPYSIESNRPGDIAEIFSDPSLANDMLGWKAKYGIEEMCLDTWNWQKNNPNGLTE